MSISCTEAVKFLKSDVRSWGRAGVSIYANGQKVTVHNRDVTTGATGAVVVVPKFSDTLSDPIPTRGGR